MSVFNFRPARTAKIDESKVVVDLDRLIAEPVYFRLKGTIHAIKPMTTRTYLSVTNEIGKMQNLRGEAEPDTKAVFDGYLRLFQTVCDTISEKDIMDMNLPQRAALIQEILRHVSGRVEADQVDEKKKAEMTPMTSA